MKEAADLLEAAEVEGLDKEIALLRVHVKELMKDGKGDLKLLMRGVETIARALIAQHRISPRRADEFAGNVAAAVKSVADQLFPELLEV